MVRRKPPRLFITELTIQIPLLEAWPAIPGLPPYQVSSEGRVRTRSGQILMTHEVKGGYKRVGLTYRKASDATSWYTGWSHSPSLARVLKGRR